MSKINEDAKKFAGNISRYLYSPTKEINEFIQQELIELYLKCIPHLDKKKFLAEIQTHEPQKIFAALWEIILVRNLLNENLVLFQPHTNIGPDWLISFEKEGYYFIEATVAQVPTQRTSEINRIQSELISIGHSASNSSLISEVKSRISSRLDEKIKKHASLFQKKEHLEKGYILAISYGGIPSSASCDLFHAVQALLPIGNLTFHIDLKSGQLGNLHLKYESQYVLPVSKSPINTDILGNEQYDWISAILLSKIEPFFLLDSAEKCTSMYWENNIKNDFILIHNPVARKPLLRDIFQSRTEMHWNLSSQSIVITGKNPFPVF